MAARVTLVDQEYNVVYDQIIKHDPNMIRNSLKRFTGLSDCSCKKGTHLN